MWRNKNWLRASPAIGAISILVIGCASDNTIRQYLDNTTAATITVGVGTTFAQARPEIAANLRDYIDVTPIEVNRGGRRALYLVCQFWSTIDRRASAGPFTAKSQLSIVADGRVIALKSSGKTLREAGIGDPIDLQSTKSSQTMLMEISVEALRTIANAKQVYANLTNDVTDTFSLWSDRRTAMVAFIAKLGHQ
ncbi:MAG TPA: hypothetical protein VET48_11740 [Steroidobacteraceae bacterium]|nr:hypothetical protein [Steroidobacteraceae bacterium]